MIVICANIIGEFLLSFYIYFTLLNISNYTGKLSHMIYLYKGLHMSFICGDFPT